MGLRRFLLFSEVCTLRKGLPTRAFSILYKLSDLIWILFVLKYYFARIWASDTTPEGAVRSSRLTPRVFPCWHHQRGAMFEPCHFRSSLNRVQAEGSAPKI